MQGHLPEMRARREGLRTRTAPPTDGRESHQGRRSGFGHHRPHRIRQETWTGIDANGHPSESLNHYSYGAICGWLFGGVCGIHLAGGDGVYYSDISGESGWSAPIKTNVINVTGAGDAMMAGLASCWVDGMPFAESVRFAQGCSSMALSCEYTNNPDLSIANVISLVENAECLN